MPLHRKHTGVHVHLSSGVISWLHPRGPWGLLAGAAAGIPPDEGAAAVHLFAGIQASWGSGGRLCSAFPVLRSTRGWFPPSPATGARAFAAALCVTNLPRPAPLLLSAPCAPAGGCLRLGEGTGVFIASACTLHYGSDGKAEENVTVGVTANPAFLPGPPGLPAPGRNARPSRRSAPEQSRLRPPSAHGPRGFTRGRRGDWALGCTDTCRLSRAPAVDGSPAPSCPELGCGQAPDN